MEEKHLSYVEAMQLKKEICDEYADCDKCPLNLNNTGVKTGCYNLLIDEAEYAEKLLLEWKKEHHINTRRDDFLKKHPHTGNFENSVCCMDFGYCNKNECAKHGYDCVVCWNCWNEQVDIEQE